MSIVTSQNGSKTRVNRRVWIEVIVVEHYTERTVSYFGHDSTPSLSLSGNFDGVDMLHVCDEGGNFQTHLTLLIEIHDVKVESLGRSRCRIWHPQ